MKSINKIVLYCFCHVALVLFIALGACEGPEGPIGPAGPEGPAGVQGPAGPAGPKGADGVDGVDGAQGLQGPAGVDGVNGVDGNANVLTVKYNAPTFGGTTTMALNAPDITTEVYNSGVVLAYIEYGGVYYSIPGITPFFGTKTQYAIGSYKITATNKDTGVNMVVAAAEDPDYVKLVLITSTKTKTVANNGRSDGNAQQVILNDLQSAGIDINDYLAVCEYYGIPVNE